MARTAWLGSCAPWLVAVLVGAACGSESPSENADATGSGGHEETSAAASGAAPDASPCDPTLPDADGDGYTAEQGDCDDCKPLVHPNGVELRTKVGETPVDEDCNGEIDDTRCDQFLEVDDPDPMSAANAIDLCKEAGADLSEWGVLDARFVRAGGDPTPASLQVGIHPQYGVVHPLVGESLLVLSTGHARFAAQPGAPDLGGNETLGQGQPPPGVATTVPGCFPESSSGIFDDFGLEVRVRPPFDAKGYRVSYRFMSSHFPEDVCSPYNDAFVALMIPPPAGRPDGNVAMDPWGGAQSVNTARFDTCYARDKGYFADFCNTFGGTCPAPPDPYCPDGSHDLEITPFQGQGTLLSGGATSWLESTVPLGDHEEFVLRFVVWDGEFAKEDSVALVDGFTWIVGDAPELATTVVRNAP